MQYDCTYESNMINDSDMEENIHSYPVYQQQHNFLASTVSNNNNNNMITTNDIYQSSLSNSNTNYQSFYFPSSIDFNNSNQYHFDYQSSTHHIDPYSNIFPNNSSIDPYSTQTIYNSTSIESSTYMPPTDSYQTLHSVYIHSNATIPSTMSQWNLDTMKMSSHDVISPSNSSKQPCVVCHEESSGYHFGAYTCESCKAFYRRVTKDPNIEIKHSCEIPLPNITKLNRKDCRACRKDKCERVGMTVISKDRIIQTKSISKSSLISMNNLLEQLAYDLTYNQLSTSSTLENLFHLLDLPSIITINFDYHSLYMNAIQIWRNQYNHFSQIFTNISLNDTFAVLLFLFYCLMIMKENNDNKLTNNIKFDKLIHILQQEINRVTGTDHRLACRIKALFMKSYVALAQYYPNSINLFDSNYNSQSQSILSYQ
ncbi:unnamed protein product [Rotaria sp. Silwood1]|nr:unnamed protein product [Rotaria sp. Silwood1]CAF3396519.1 unnamed protein product [Rotaria sp. Silwood1]CAF4526000.1 unnamed protein product [Rotaria sp. Silwood1]CAF4571361.1 unnamed protein product [Rotaria sp. Silwood1]